MSRAQHYCPEFKYFAGAAHVMSDDDNNTIPPSLAPHEHRTHRQPIESSDQTRES